MVAANWGMYTLWLLPTLKKTTTKKHPCISEFYFTKRRSRPDTGIRLPSPHGVKVNCKKKEQATKADWVYRINGDNHFISSLNFDGE